MAVGRRMRGGRPDPIKALGISTRIAPGLDRGISSSGKPDADGVRPKIPVHRMKSVALST